MKEKEMYIVDVTEDAVVRVVISAQKQESCTPIIIDVPDGLTIPDSFTIPLIRKDDGITFIPTVKSAEGKEIELGWGYSKEYKGFWDYSPYAPKTKTTEKVYYYGECQTFGSIPTGARLNAKTLASAEREATRKQCFVGTILKVGLGIDEGGLLTNIIAVKSNGKWENGADLEQDFEF